MQGLGTFNVTNNAPFSAGPPFPAQAADNGLSVDPITGRIVLGNDVGGALAQLTSIREIPINNQILRLLDNGFITDFNGNAIQLYAPAIPNASCAMEVSNTRGQMVITSDTLGGLLPGRLRLTDQGFTTTELQQRGFAFEIMNVASRMISLDQSFGTYQFGDINGGVGGWYFVIQAGTGNHEIRNDVTGERIQLWDTGVGQVISGDVAVVSTGMQELIDIPTGEHSVRNTALNAFYSCNGVAGFTGTVTPVTSITVNGGIVTAVT